MRRPLLLTLLTSALLCAGCHDEAVPASANSGGAEGQPRVPVDRLGSNELAAGSAEVWGFAVPREMHVEHRYEEAAYIFGPVKPDALSDYVRARVTVAHVEIGPARTIFPEARIKGGAPERLYEFEVIPQPGATRLVIHDVTPPKVMPGLSDEERWRQAGLTPQGRPLDMKKFE